MENLEIVGREALGFEQRDRQAVAEGQLHGRRRCWRQPVRAGLFGARQQQHDVGLLAERRLGARRDRDQRHGEAARIGDQRLQFHRLARPRQRQDEVIARDHAEIAVRGFARMHEEGRRAGRGKGRGDLLADVAALADAGDDDPALDGDETANRICERLGERTVDFGRKLRQAFVLECQRAQRALDRGRRSPCRPFAWSGSFLGAGGMAFCIDARFSAMVPASAQLAGAEARKSLLFLSKGPAAATRSPTSNAALKPELTSIF